MKKIYVLLMHTNTKPSKFVKFMTRYEYSHVALSLDKECTEIYSFGRRKLHSILGGGFTVENKDGEFFKNFNETICKIYELVIEDEQYEKVKEIINDMKLNINTYKYDFLGTGLRFLYIPITFKNRYVCSYFVADILEKSNVYHFKKKSYFIKPKDFEKLKGFNEIYNGKYFLYQQT